MPERTTWRTVPRSYSDELNRLTESLLRQDPAQRPSVPEILQVPYLQQWLRACHDILTEAPLRSQAPRSNAPAPAPAPGPAPALTPPLAPTSPGASEAGSVWEAGGAVNGAASTASSVQSFSGTTQMAEASAREAKRQRDQIEAMALDREALRAFLKGPPPSEVIRVRDREMEAKAAASPEPEPEV